MDSSVHHAKAIPFLATVSTVILCIALFAGQLLRLPLPGQGGGLLLSDMATSIVLFLAFIQFIRHPDRLVVGSLLVLTPFFLWVTWGTSIATLQHSSLESSIIWAYWLRLMTTLFLLPAILSLFAPLANKKRLLYGLAITAGLLSLAGLLQWWFVPNLAFLTSAGWDPHQGRVVSTWLDPNFFGVFLAMIVPLVLANRSRYIRLWLVLILPALLLTSSRSSFIALALALGVLFPFLVAGLLVHTQKAALVISIALAGLVLAGGLLSILMLGDRAIGLLYKDPTVQLRLDSLKTASQVIENHSWLGVGYNAYQFATRTPASAATYTIHSRAGADNSYVTLWATTGLFGLILFVTPLAGLFIWLLRRWFKNYDVVAFSAALSLLTLFIQANFINSLLYSHLLIVAIMISVYSFSE